MTRLLALTVMLALAGCGSAPEQEKTVKAPDEDGPDYVQAIRTMSEGQRNGVMIRAIRDAKQDCQDVTRVVELPPVRGNGAWNATCRNGMSWTVIVERNGDATVTNAPNPAPAGKAR